MTPQLGLLWDPWYRSFLIGAVTFLAGLIWAVMVRRQCVAWWHAAALSAAPVMMIHVSLPNSWILAFRLQLVGDSLLVWALRDASASAGFMVLTGLAGAAVGSLLLRIYSRRKLRSSLAVPGLPTRRTVVGSALSWQVVSCYLGIVPFVLSAAMQLVHGQAIVRQGAITFSDRRPAGRSWYGVEAYVSNLVDAVLGANLLSDDPMLSRVLMDRSCRPALLTIMVDLSLVLPLLGLAIAAVRWRPELQAKLRALVLLVAGAAGVGAMLWIAMARQQVLRPHPGTIVEDQLTLVTAGLCILALAVFLFLALSELRGSSALLSAWLLGIAGSVSCLRFVLLTSLSRAFFYEHHRAEPLGRLVVEMAAIALAVVAVGFVAGTSQQNRGSRRPLVPVGWGLLLMGGAALALSVHSYPPFL